MADSILVETHENWVEITLNRPEKLNSFNDEMHRALKAALQSALEDKKRAILLTGANLAMACDIVLASEKAKFVQSFVNVGLMPDAGGTWNLTRLLGPARAKGLAMTGEPIMAALAADWGMIWKAVSPEELLIEARALTERLANGPTTGLAHVKQAISAASSNSLDDQLELEARFQKICGESQDYAEGVSAFLEKRAAVFKGL